MAIIWGLVGCNATTTNTSSSNSSTTTTTTTTTTSTTTTTTHPNDDSNYHQIPLQNVKVDVTIADNMSDTTARLEFRNETNIPLETEFRMPVNNNVTIYSLKAIINESETIQLKCVSKNEANKTYKDAISRGKTAIMGKEDKHSSDIFKMKLGNVPANAKITLILKFSSILNVDQKKQSITYELLTVLNLPRYSPPDFNDNYNDNDDDDTIPRATKPYTFEIKVRIEGAQKIRNITSDTEKEINVTYQDDNSVAIVNGGKFKSDHDWNINIEYDNVFQSRIMCEKEEEEEEEEEEDIIAINIIPNIKEEEKNKKKKKKREILVFVDMSNSMSFQNREEYAKKALMCLIKSIPYHYRFNIIKFGSSFEMLDPDHRSIKYTKSSLKDAEEFCKNMSATMIGTEIMKPLKHVFEMTSGNEEEEEEEEEEEVSETRVVLITDGEVLNIKDIANLIRKQVKTNVFAIGIGDGCSSTFIDEITTAGRGQSFFVKNEKKLPENVMNCLTLMIQPAIQNVKITYENKNKNKKKKKNNKNKKIKNELTFFPTIPEIMYNGRQYNFFAKVPRDTVITKINIDGDMEDSETYHQTISECIAVTSGGFLRNMYYTAKIRQLCQEYNQTRGKEIETEIIQVSEKSGVISPLTSYIGVVNDDQRHIIQQPSDVETVNNNNTFSTPTFGGGGYKRTTFSCLSFGGGYKHEEEKKKKKTKEEEDHDEELLSIIENQTFEGYWDSVFLLEEIKSLKLSNLIQNYLNSDYLPTGSEIIQDDNKLSSLFFELVKHYKNVNVVVTWIILAILQIKYAKKEDIWNNIAKKAKSFIINNYVDIDDPEKDEKYMIGMKSILKQ